MAILFLADVAVSLRSVVAAWLSVRLIVTSVSAVSVVSVVSVVVSALILATMISTVYKVRLSLVLFFLVCNDGGL